MVYFHSSIYYVRYKILFTCWKLVLTPKRSSFRLFFSSCFFTIVFFLHQALDLFFRIIDELFFFRYRHVIIKQPVFIFANPRSGSTYLHQLMTNDDRFVYMKLAHTIFPSASFAKLYKLFSYVDRKTGNPLKWLIKRSESLFFSGWKDIHPLAFNKTEEDEGIYTFALISPAVFLAFPFLHLVKESWLLDNDGEKVKKGIMNYYENSLKRFMYAQGSNKIYLSKNVLSSGRINCLLQRFPDAKVVYAVRNPYEALPSFISMFGAMYAALSPRMKANDEAMQAWAFLGIAFYKHFNEARKNIAENNLVEIKYDDLVTKPSLTIEKIYAKLQFDMSSAMKERLARLEERNKNYKSKHYYSLDQYGLSKDYIYGELKFLFDQFDFK